MFFKILATLALLPAALAIPTSPSPDSTELQPKGISRAYLVNCYTNPTDGTRGEVDFYRKAPLATFGHASPEINSVVSDGINEIWENNGGTTSTPVKNGATFGWTINYTQDSVESVPPGFEVGNASISTGQKFALFKGDLEKLYSFGTNPEYSCGVVYTAVQTNQS